MDKINKLEATHSFTVMPRDCNYNLDKRTNGDVEEICSSNMTFVTMKDGKPFPHNLTWDKLTN